MRSNVSKVNEYTQKSSMAPKRPSPRNNAIDTSRNMRLYVFMIEEMCVVCGPFVFNIFIVIVCAKCLTLTLPNIGETDIAYAWLSVSSPDR